MRPYLKNKVKRAECMALLIRGKHEALSSNSSTSMKRYWSKARSEM
jgi:hypothetical protein